MAVAELLSRRPSRTLKIARSTSRHRRTGCRQGLSERRGSQASEELRCAQLHSGEAAEGQAPLAGQGRRAASGYENRRRVRGDYGKSLLKRRGELVERSFAHCYETGGMRRCHSARTREHSQAATGPCERLQPEPDHAPTAGRGHATGAEKPRGAASFASFLVDHEPESAQRRV
jgi:hypothetical protein